MMSFDAASSTDTFPASQTRGTVMSGMRATGVLHMGHYLGVLRNWVELQSQHQAYFMVADWHSLTTKLDEAYRLPEHRYEMVLDWLAAGVNPEASTIYYQSAVPEIAELHLLLSMATPHKWCETDPTLKDMVLSDEQGLSYGLLGYPVLQTADILAMQGNLVPVGKDQLAHLEISRDIVRRFNHLTGTSLFAEPRHLLTETPSVIGLDGRKMSKSYGNTIALGASEDDTVKAIKTAITDASRIRKDDPGHPEQCVAVYPWYTVFETPEVCETVARECRLGQRGCMACKTQLAARVNETLRPIREKRALFANDKAQVLQVIREGNERARDQAAGVLQQVRQALHLL
jgi:tryptophanyl-tRNA synthetase